MYQVDPYHMLTKTAFDLMSSAMDEDGLREVLRCIHIGKFGNRCYICGAKDVPIDTQGNVAQDLNQIVGYRDNHTEHCLAVLIERYLQWKSERDASRSPLHP